MARTMRRAIEHVPIMVGIARTRIALVAAAALAASAAACGRLLPADGDVASGGDPNEPARGAQLASAPLDASAEGAEAAVASDATKAAADVVTAPSIDRDDWIVFVTTTKYRVGDLHGLEGADTRCMERARAGLPVLHDRTFKAWVSGRDIAMKDIIGDDDGPWLRPDGVLVATNRDHLLGNDPLGAPIVIDETGGTRGGPAWTGTSADGTTSSWGTCDDWTSAAAGARTVIGLPSVTKEWTNGFVDACGSDLTGTRAYHLYCFEVRN